MVAIAAPPPLPLTFAAAGGRAASLRPRIPYFTSVSCSASSSRRPRHQLRLLSSSSRLYSSKPPSSSFNGGPNSSLYSTSSSAGGGGEFCHGLPPSSPSPPPGGGAVVYVTLPADVVSPTGQLTRRKTMKASFMALAAAGIEGVVVEFWWGIVEREAPGVYDWGGYLDVVAMARFFGLKVRAIMAFHQGNFATSSLGWLSLPQWVLEEMDKDPDLAYSDRLGRRSKEYLSLGCDMIPILKGRSPIQAYSDFMRSFKDNFMDFLGDVISEIQVGMGPAGELRYPSYPTEKLMQAGTKSELGEFQCYDKYMLASLRSWTRDAGMREWEHGPLGAASFMQNPEETPFFKSDGSWNTPHGHLFLEWYSDMLLAHGERLCMAADLIFQKTGVMVSAKVAGIHWHYWTSSHPSELTAGYYNTIRRDGYLPIVRMFGRYRMALCCTCFDIRDADERKNLKSSPEGFIRQLVFAARMHNLPLNGENSSSRFDDDSFNQVIKSSRLYLGGGYNASLSFNYVRMNKDMFDRQNWNRFAKFVKRMSDSRTFQARLQFRGIESCLPSFPSVEEVGRSSVYHYH